VSKVNKEYQLQDKYLLESGRVFLTGTQALVRLPLMQRQKDLSEGLNTAGYISGYTGSPLGGYDHALNQASDLLKENHIVFQPGINEDMAATAVHGSQQSNLIDNPKYDGVFGVWYGKGPGVDRSGDALKHGNYAGTSEHGGVLVLAGDDHGAKSSTTSHQSDHAFIHYGIPTLNPATVQDYLDFGMYGWAMSRYSSLWIGMKCVTDTVESGASVDINQNRLNIKIPEDFSLPEENYHIQWGFAPAASEERLFQIRLPALEAFVRNNDIDKEIFPSTKGLAIVTAGKAYLDVRQALEELGLDEKKAKEKGISLFKVGMTWPLEPSKISKFLEGHEEVLVVEEKRPIIEDQLAKILFNKSSRPRLVGKSDEEGKDLLPSDGELSPSLVALVIGNRLTRLTQDNDLEEKISSIKSFIEGLNSSSGSDLMRLPSFCAGCPHNTSTKVPEGSVAFGGIGCHGMATFLPERKTLTLCQMGGEGVMWTGIAPFTETNHLFQNLGDGTYYHSGILALRSSIASGANITYKILVNDAIAMTGGQEITGKVKVDDLSWQVYSEGAKKIAVVSDYPEKYPSSSKFAPGVTVHHRDEMDKIQTEFRECKGVSVIIYDQYCATELRRRRKRGLADEPQERIFINPLVCEGCGDCSFQSNCIAIEPLETDFGRKRQINQSSCNKDFSCVKGYCPSFVKVKGGSLRKKADSQPENSDKGELAGYLKDIPKPAAVQSSKPYNILITGIGGSGVITLGALLGTAAHLEGKGSSTLDVAGLAQRNGPVTSHLRVADNPEDLHATRIASGAADLILGCDIVVTTGLEAMSKIKPGLTNVIVNSHVAPTSAFASNPNLDLSSARMKKSLKDSTSEGHLDFIEATKLATALMGNSIAANLFIVGYAMQKGLLPMSVDAVERAIELNEVAVEMNKQSLSWGRLAAVNINLVREKALPKKEIEPSKEIGLDEIIKQRKTFLEGYQNKKYADKYEEFVRNVQREEKKIVKEDFLSQAVAKYYFKLLAYKDEFEVARLLTSKEFKGILDQQIEGDYKLEYSLAPPVFGGRDSKTGRYPKRQLPSIFFFFFNVLKHLKFLRGSPLNFFGWSAHRKLERKLIDDYEETIGKVLKTLSRDKYHIAVDIASIPEFIRGFDVVKEQNLETALLRQEELFNLYNSDFVPAEEIETKKIASN